jgi:hypothetical protein
VAKSKVTTAVALLPTAVQKQQVVAAFTVSGTLERARPLIATLWGVEEAALPDDVELRAWVGDIANLPEKTELAIAHRYAQAAYHAQLYNLQDKAIARAETQLDDGKGSLFNVTGLIKTIGDQLHQAVAPQTNIIDLRGASFKTAKQHGKTNEVAIEGEFTAIDVEGD